MKFRNFLLLVLLWCPDLAVGRDTDPGSAIEELHDAPAMQYRVIRAGPSGGSHPTRSSGVRVRYEGRYPDGRIFDNHGGKEAVLPVRSLVPGFQQALLMMRPGDIWEILVPYQLAYGETGSALAGQSLRFRIELIEWAELPPPPPPPFLAGLPSQ